MKGLQRPVGSGGLQTLNACHKCVQDAAASLAVPLAASLLGCLAVLALIGLVVALYVRHRRRRSRAVSAQKKGEALPVTISARAPQQVQAALFLHGIVVCCQTLSS